MPFLNFGAKDKTRSQTERGVRKAAFTLAGTPCSENLRGVARCAFTLAEVLIVIGVIGVVAAITIPTLINTISKNAKKAQTEVIEARLLDGLNRYSATDDGLSQKHATTYDFLKGLSAHYKMAQICEADKIENCFPYDKIYSSDGTDSADISSLKTIDTLVAGDAANNYLAPASFITAQGTPVVMALKKDCAWDMGTAMRSVEDSGCIVYMYDKNGTSLPNRMGSDLINHGLSIKGFPLAVLGGVKIMTTAKVPTALTKAQCEAEVAKKSEYTAIKDNPGISACYYENDYWAGAMKECKEQGLRLPTEAELTAMANALYPDVEIAATGRTNGNINTSLIPEALSGLSSPWYGLWSGSEYSSSRAYYRDFNATWSTRYYSYRLDSTLRAVCVSD